LLECWAGRLPVALGHALAGRDAVSRLGVRVPILASSLVLVLAHLGQVDEARSLGLQDVATDESLGYVSGLALHRRSLGFLELVVGDNAAAADHLVGAWQISVELGGRDPGLMRLHGDGGRALAAQGRGDQAREF